MNSSIKVVKKDIKGFLSTDFDEDQIAMEIAEQENSGWQLVSSYGIRLSHSMGGVGITDTIVFIYRKK